VSADTTRRGFFGVIAGAAVAPLVVKQAVPAAPVVPAVHQAPTIRMIASTTHSWTSTPWRSESRE
jgi:hypothetical protein